MASLVSRVTDLTTSVGGQLKSIKTLLDYRIIFIERDETGGTYPLRNTRTTSSTVVVVWIGTVAPTSGGGYALAGKDFFWRKT